MRWKGYICLGFDRSGQCHCHFHHPFIFDFQFVSYDLLKELRLGRLELQSSK